MSEENLSILSLILDASLLVQLVMAILFIASVISWIMIVQRGIYLRNAERGTIEDVLEPYLIQQGFLMRTSRGRIATRMAYEHFGLASPKRLQEQLDGLSE